MVNVKSGALLASTASLVAVLALAGCSGSSSASSSASSGESSEALVAAEQTVEAPEPEILEIGKDGAGVLSVTFTNKLGNAIADIAVEPADSDADPTYLMEDGQDWAKGEDALVHFADEGDVPYNVYVKTKKGEYVLHALAISSADSVTLRVEDGVAYATFSLDGSEVSSLSDELALKEQAEAEAAAEEAAAEEAAEEVYYEETYDAPAQTEDSCIEGGVQLR